jgi:hypothetical protein
MIEYKLIIYLDDGVEIKTVKYEKDYELRKDIANIGINGFLKMEEDKYIYFPAHRINKIEVKIKNN